MADLVLVRDKEIEAREGQDFTSGPEAISGPENSAFRKNGASPASKKEHKNVERDSKNQTGVLHPNCALVGSPGELRKAYNIWWNQSLGDRLWPHCFYLFFLKSSSIDLGDNEIIRSCR